MRTLLTPAFTLPLLMPLALLAACGDEAGGSTDIRGTLRFEDRTDTEIARMINAAVGAEMFQAQARVDQFGDTFDPDPCPNISISGTTATVTGGCTTRDGVVIGGAAVVTNPHNWDQVEVGFGADAVYEMTDLSFTDGTFTQRFDGRIEIGGDFLSWDADLTTDSFDIQLRSDIYMSCSGNASQATCRVSNSGLELIDVGGATVSGTQRLANNRVTTDLTLRGVDTLQVHVADNCVEWHVEGTSRMSMVCPQ
jgi:hypothetical protein